MSNSVTNIGKGAFNDCDGLSSIIIPNSVSIIGEGAFKNLSYLTDVYCYAIGVPHTNTDVFYNSNTKQITLHVPESSLTVYKELSPWSEFKVIVPLPTYTLTYIVDGETYKTFEYEEYGKITIEKAPQKEGYTFSGWDEVPETMPGHNVEVIGSYVVNKYQLTYKVDDAVYKSYDIEYGTSIVPDMAPEKKGYSFVNWSNMPETMPANDVIVYATYKKKLGRCAAPTITYKNRKIKFESEEEGVEFVWTVTIAEPNEGRGSETEMSEKCIVSVYATKEDYEDSDIVTMTLDIRGLKGDIDDNGTVDAADLTKLVNILLQRD